MFFDILNRLGVDHSCEWTEPAVAIARSNGPCWRQPAIEQKFVYCSFILVLLQLCERLRSQNIKLKSGHCNALQLEGGPTAC